LVKTVTFFGFRVSCIDLSPEREIRIRDIISQLYVIMSCTSVYIYMYIHNTVFGYLYLYYLYLYLYLCLSIYIYIYAPKSDVSTQCPWFIPCPVPQVKWPWIPWSWGWLGYSCEGIYIAMYSSNMVI
jgi:hypothetical protein